MPGFDSDTVGGGGTLFATNVDFTGSSFTQGSPQVTANGQLLIGSAAVPQIRVGTLTSPLGTLSIGYSSPNITIDLAGGSTGVDSIAVDTTTGAGTNPVLPTGAGLVTFTGGQYATGTFGTRVLTINSPAANTVDVEVQISSTNASSLVTKNGVSHFNSSDFSVDANGFVSIISGGFAWSNKSANFNAVAENGYFITGTCTATLPTNAGSAIGDTIKFIVQGAFVLTLQAAASQKIQIASNLSSAAGTQVSTANGDAVEIVFNTTGNQWDAMSFVGAWNFT